MECSVCQSTNLVKVSLAYEQGLSEYKGRSRSHGLSLGTGGLGLWGGRAKTTGTFQTRLSARLSPPTKWSYWKTFKWWLAGLIILWFVGIAVQENAHNAKEFSRAIRLGDGRLCRRSGLSVVVYLAIQPPRVSGSAQTLGPFVHVPTLR